jgi:hypothetical protein
METGWALRFRTSEEEVHAWTFYVALVLFPHWRISAFWRVPKTRVIGGTDTEKAVPLDDPQTESGAFSFSTVCARAMFWRVAELGQMRALGVSVVASWRNRDEFLKVMDPNLSSPNLIMLFISMKGGPLFVHRTYSKIEGILPFFQLVLQTRCMRGVRSNLTEGCLGSRCDARPSRLVSASQHESILARSQESVLEHCGIVIVIPLHRYRRVVVDLWCGDERKDSCGRRDIMAHWTVEKLYMR